MRRLSMLAVMCLMMAGVAFAQSPQAGSDGIGDRYYPQLGNGGYDVQHYDIDLTAHLATNSIDATVTIQANATEALKTFNLDFEGLKISRLTVDGAPAAYQRAGHELTVTPSSPLASGAAFEVVVRYSGVPGQDIDDHGAPAFADGWTQYPGGVFVASEPSGAARWFPCNDHPLDKATYSFRITVPKPNVAAANGVLEQTIPAGDSTTYVFSEMHPMATYLATVNIGDLARLDGQSASGVPLRSYVPTKYAASAPTVLANLPEMVDTFSRLFGPYPFETYGVVVVDTGLNFALETQTMSLFGGDLLRGSSLGRPPDEVLAHELAHQWFGDSVSLSQWQDIWLNEGFATYAQALWIEHTRGRAALDDYMTNLYTLISSPTFTASKAIEPGQPPPDDLFNRSIYLRGGWTLHAIRLRVGDDTFFNILRTYYGRYQYGNATTADFIAVADEVSGQPLDDLIDSWLYADNVPPVPEMGLGIVLATPAAIIR